MTTDRFCVCWFEGGKPKERGLRLKLGEPLDRVRAAEVKAIAACDAGEEVTVFLTSLDAEDTYGFFVWEDGEYKYHELG